MADKAAKHRLIYRPHLKTPQSVEIARWYRNAGVRHITVSSLRMAEYFASDGWDDITVAFPVNIRETERINKLAGNITLNLIADSPFAVESLGKNLNKPVNLYIEIDTGQHRSGIAPTDMRLIDEIINQIHAFEKTKFTGFLTHAGHTYNARSHEQILAAHQGSLKAMNILRTTYSNIHKELCISIGDTPACSIADDFKGADEMRPGNCIFYDLKMTQITACRHDDIAVAMACPVVSLQPQRNECIIYGGAVHFSKDAYRDEKGRLNYGKAVRLTENGWSQPVADVYLSALSQEHGTLSCTVEYMKTLKPGDIIGILPVHSCLTADCMKCYYTLEGEKINMLQNMQ